MVTDCYDQRNEIFLCIVTVCNVVTVRLYFHKHLSFCPRGGGVSQHALGHTPLPGQTPPLGRDPGRHPPGRHTHIPSAYGHCSGRYASYWNAFLYWELYWVVIATNKDCNREQPFCQISWVCLHCWSVQRTMDEFTFYAKVRLNTLSGMCLKTIA